MNVLHLRVVNDHAIFARFRARNALHKLAMGAVRSAARGADMCAARRGVNLQAACL